MTNTGWSRISRQILGKHINFKTITRSKIKNSCEEEDCCGNIIEQCKPTVVIERTCHPCCFETWKPELPDLLCAPKPKKVPKPRKKKKCYAGMVIPQPKSLKEIKKEAAQCFKECGAKPICPPKKKVLTKKHYATFCPPQPDWDHDGFMQ